MSDADLKLDIGRQLTHGLGAGSDPEVGRLAAEEHRSEIEEALKGADMVFITAGKGGGTGTGAAPVVAEIASEPGGAHRRRRDAAHSPSRAGNGPARPRRDQAPAREVDTLIIIPNDRLLQVVERRTSIIDAFKMATTCSARACRASPTWITVPGLINQTSPTCGPSCAQVPAQPSWASASTGGEPGGDAARAAISSPLLEASIEGARGILLNITGGADLALFEVTEAAQIIGVLPTAMRTSFLARSSTMHWATRCGSP